MFEIESLLRPISDDRLTGPNLRLIAEDTTFRDLEEFRREEDAAFSASGEEKTADWRNVADLAASALETKSKDFQLAAYLTEASTRLDGFSGLAAGLSLTRQLIEDFWLQLHPGYEEDGEIFMALRAKWISWMGTSRDFLSAVKAVPITSGPGVEPYAWRHYEESQRMADAAAVGDPTAYEEMVASGMITEGQWESALGGTPRERLNEVLEALRTCDKEVTLLETLCNEFFTEDEPSVMELRGVVRDCLEHVEAAMAGESVAAADAGGEAAAGESVGDEGVPAAGGGGPAGPIRTRDEAYRRLREVADFLRRTEPHSPVSLLVERAIHWGSMSFPDMIRDVLGGEDTAYSTILDTLGIAEKENDE